MMACSMRGPFTKIGAVINRNRGPDGDCYPAYVQDLGRYSRPVPC